MIRRADLAHVLQRREVGYLVRIYVFYNLPQVWDRTRFCKSIKLIICTYIIHGVHVGAPVDQKRNGVMLRIAAGDVQRRHSTLWVDEKRKEIVVK